MISKRFNIKYSLPFNFFFFCTILQKAWHYFARTQTHTEEVLFIPFEHSSARSCSRHHVSLWFLKNFLSVILKSKYKSNMYIKKQPKQNCTILKNMEDRWRDLQSQNWGPQHVMYLMPKTRNMSACKFEFSGINLYKSYKTRSGRPHRGSNVQCLCNITI